jgi:hypothetical protein
MFLLGILIFKGLTARCLYKSFGVKGLIELQCKVKVNLFLCTLLRRIGGAGVYIHTFLTSQFYVRSRTPIPVGLTGGIFFGEEIHFFPVTGFEPWTAQLVVY